MFRTILLGVLMVVLLAACQPVDAAPTSGVPATEEIVKRA